MMESTIKEYFAAKEEIAAVYLFGSFAAGTNAPMSDVDIAILFRREYMSSADSFIVNYGVELGRRLRKDIHPVILNQAGEVLLKQVLRKGKPVLVKDHKADKLFKMIAVARIADFEVYLQAMQAGLKKKILEG